jgi:uridylate kinase
MGDVVISVGGSIIAAGNIDTDFLKSFRKLILEFSAEGNRVFIVAGGGKPARDYIEAAKEIVPSSSQEDLDWLGIRATMINAELVRTVFGKAAYEKVVSDPTEKISTPKKLLVASGWKPGWSSDYDAVLLAENFGVKTVVNLTNVDYVYDKNPKKFSDAKPLKKLTWEDMKKLVGDKWEAGLNAPFDPIASKLACALKLRVVILNGKNLENFSNFLHGREFTGSVISD